MIFNSLSFLIFLPIVFIIYWSIKSTKYRNVILLFASFYFYACWDIRFLALLIFSTLLDYLSGIKIFESNKKSHQKKWLILSIGINLGFLGFFKYYNFFASTFQHFLLKLGFESDISTLNIILPIGISFYTFHGISYLVDIYKEKIKPEKNIVNYSLFVAYFPLLVAGPIERATHLLPQLKTDKKFNYDDASSGLKQILWGLFKKIVIADNCAKYVNQIYNFETGHNGSSFIIASILFAFQIYGDFSGYSDIALGTSRLFGIELIKNFSFPYFSRDIAEFWRRWHISLSSWFRDYVYIPLGGSKKGLLRSVINTFIIFILSGFWHGANWTFIIWGLLNALYFLPLLLMNKNRTNFDLIAKDRYLPTFKEFFQIVFTFFLVVLGWIFFRSPNIDVAFRILNKIFTLEGIFSPSWSPKTEVITFTIIMILIEWNNRQNKHTLEKFGVNWNPICRYAFYYFIIFALFWFAGEEQQFIYFQF